MTINYCVLNHYMSETTQKDVVKRIKNEKNRGDLLYTTYKSRLIAQEVFETLCEKYDIQYIKEENLGNVTYKKA